MKINFDKLKIEFFEKFSMRICGYSEPEIRPPVKAIEIFEWFKDKLTPKVRTLSQNKALHLWLTQIANILNESGQTRYNEMGIPSRYTMDLLKGYWKDLQRQLFDIESTTEMTSTILNNLIDSFTLWLIEQKGVKPPKFPNRLRYINELDAKNKLK